MRVLVRRDLQRQSLVHRAPGHPVELGARHLEHRDPSVGRDQQRFPQPGVPLGLLGDVHRDRRHSGPQRFHHRVPAGHDLAGGVRLGPPGRGLACALLLRGLRLRLGGRAPGCRVPGPCGRRRRRALAFQPAPDPATGAGGRIALLGLADRALAAAAARHQKLHRGRPGCPRRSRRASAAGRGSRPPRRSPSAPGPPAAAPAGLPPGRRRPGQLRRRRTARPTARPVDRARARRASPAPSRGCRGAARSRRPRSACCPRGSRPATRPARPARRGRRPSRPRTRHRSASPRPPRRRPVRSPLHVALDPLVRHRRLLERALGVLHRRPVVRRHQVVAQLDRPDPLHHVADDRAVAE